MAARLTDRQKKFQSTRPARGATQTALDRLATSVISIHAPREGRDMAYSAAPAPVNVISIHAPREGRDVKKTIKYTSA